jgi:hypothetical protein
MNVTAAPSEIRFKKWPFLLCTAALGALLTTVLPAVSIACLYALRAASENRMPFESVPTVWDIAKASFYLCALTLVWFGFFGLVAGAAEGAVLYCRRAKIRTIRRLLLESAVFGVVVTLLLPLDAAAVLAVRQRDIDYRFFIACWIVGLVPCVGIFVINALVFRKRFVQPTISDITL